MNLPLAAAFDAAFADATSLPVDAGPHGLRWGHSYAALGAAFHTELTPRPLPQPYWVIRSERAAQTLGLPANWASHEPFQALEVFTGNALWTGMRPLAGVYSGHQFGAWAGQLGDGRAILLGELEGPDGRAWEVQLKGSGLTPYSRMGDGRAVLRSCIREFLCSEAMQGLGIPTTRALCVTGSDAPVRREQMETAAVVTRLSPSFIRFGHFEHFAYSGQQQALRALADQVIERFYPDCREQPQPYAALLDRVTRRTAELMADWQAVGFCHGVMNTDNMSILGLTIDYGPFGFLDAFDPTHICNHSDSFGRYAYNRQPNVALWNLYSLGQALMPLIGDSELALAALEPYKTVLPQALEQRMNGKLGLRESRDGDGDLVERLLRLMAEDRVDYTIAFRHLNRFDSGEQAANPQLRDLFLQRDAFDAWARNYGARLRAENSADAERARRMDRVNPKYILRNYLAEQAIRQARQKDFSEVRRLLQVLERPYDECPEFESYAGFPPDWAASIEVSCSS